MAGDSVALTRDERIDQRTRNPKWQNIPVRIEMLECINCDACLRACPPNFGAIFNHGADVDALNRFGHLPLHNAARRGKPDMITLLLDHGADINAKAGEDNTALCFNFSM